ncbi:oxidoreductase [Sphaerisporangium melleum]|uniref:Oxidoreductase n=1 Tax=Sphaerisporangium melleum TaxID=321316 RepID=A0A917R4B1_9ACTN|nr:2Fe-2S iron-sulfur cluster-binding protein [Sphaerisporangium melleum]GGK89564.1 oxidoreductase [Sphaerisporangium melleum]GII72517.1 oxidoreductase [Sphaerisporangium melleum]
MTGQANTSGDAAAPPPVGADLRISVNGAWHALTVDTRESLLDTLRDRLGLTGAKKGCDHGQCGACTVLIDGRRVLSCLTLTVSLDDESVTTVEGLGLPGAPHPLQRAFVEHDALQCGFCTPGQICSAVGVLAEAAEGRPSLVTHRDRAHPGGSAEPVITGALPLDEEEIRERMSGNLCRCGAYPGILAAIAEAARAGEGAR